MKVDIVRGRLGQHRFHPMLVHFPSALYPFSFAMDLTAYMAGEPKFAFAGLCALIGALSVSALAIVYGAIDFLQIDASHKAWKIAALHGLLNTVWLIAFSLILASRLKHDASHDAIYLIILSGVSTVGLIVSNYLGAELIIRHKIGID